MKMRIWMMLLLIVCVLPASAQDIGVEEFKRLHRSWLTRLLGHKVTVDKNLATLDLYTGEKGFTFKADGTTEVKADEQDGMLVLKMPHHTRFLVIQHPDYGQKTWKVPLSKGLRKKKHYQAVLHTSGVGKEFKLSKQWVVFRINPAHAVIQIDSTMAQVNDGVAQFFLPLGNHHYKVESPFHYAVEDSLQLNDSIRLEVPVLLQPFYSYLTVNVAQPDYGIYVDNQFIGRGTATSGHLSPGIHQVTVRKGSVFFYDRQVSIEAAEKRTLDITADSLRPYLMAQRGKQIISTQEGAKPAVNSRGTINRGQMESAPVTITAANDSTEIWVDRERVGVGVWKGNLTKGFHVVNSFDRQMESEPLFLWIEDTFPKTVNLMSPQEEYGMLNIHSNVIGAYVLINGLLYGQTPCVVKNLPSKHSYEITLRHEDYRDVTVKVKPRGNDMMDVELKMKKTKKNK